MADGPNIETPEEVPIPSAMDDELTVAAQTDRTSEDIGGQFGTLASRGVKAAQAYQVMGRELERAQGFGKHALATAAEKVGMIPQADKLRASAEASFEMVDNIGHKQVEDEVLDEAKRATIVTATPFLGLFSGGMKAMFRTASALTDPNLPRKIATTIRNFADIGIDPENEEHRKFLEEKREASVRLIAGEEKEVEPESFTERALAMEEQLSHSQRMLTLNLFAQGMDEAAILNAASVTAGDVVGNLAVMKLLFAAGGEFTGIKTLRGSGGATQIGRAAQYAVANYIRTPGTAEQKEKSALLGFFYMSTPAASGKMPTDISAIGVDFILNSLISMGWTAETVAEEWPQIFVRDSETGMIIPGGQYEEAVNRAIETANELGNPDLAWKILITEMMGVMGPDIGFSLLTRSARAERSAIQSETTFEAEIARQVAPQPHDVHPLLLRAPRATGAQALEQSRAGFEQDRYQQFPEIVGQRIEDATQREGNWLRQDVELLRQLEAEGGDPNEIQAVRSRIESRARQYQALRNRATSTGRLSPDDATLLPDLLENAEASRIIHPDGKITKPDGTLDDPEPVESGVPPQVDPVTAEAFGVRLQNLLGEGWRYKSGDLRESVLPKVMEIGGPRQKKLARYLVENFGDQLEDIPVWHANINTAVRDSSGRWREAAAIYQEGQDGRKVTLNFARLASDPQKVSEAILHETVHGVVATKVQAWLDSPDTVSPEDRVAFQRLEDVRQDVMQILQRDPEGSRGFENFVRDEQEFISNALTSDEFRDYLRQHEGRDGRSLWRRFVDSVKSIMGVKTETGIVTDIDNAIETVMNLKRPPSATQVAIREAMNMEQERQANATVSTERVASANRTADVSHYDGIAARLEAEAGIPQAPEPRQTAFGEVTGDPRQDLTLLQAVFHGSPHKWQPEPGFPNGRPRLDFTGKGEGSAAFGWGFYTGEARGVAETYFQRFFREAHEGRTLGSVADVSLYKLDVPDDVLPRLLDWDNPVADAQAEAIAKVVGEGFDARPFQTGPQGRVFTGGRNMTGEDVYETLVFRHERAGMTRAAAKEAASIDLRDAGIPGMKFLDQQSRDLVDARVQFSEESRTFDVVDSRGNLLKEFATQEEAEAAAQTTQNHVIWDQPTLDRVVALERNGEKLQAIRDLSQGLEDGSLTLLSEAEGRREDPVAAANRTARPRGRFAQQALTPRHVVATVKKGERVLNYGAGKPNPDTGTFVHSDMVREAGGIVDEFDFGANTVGELGKQYDTVFASNVLNVQSDGPMLRNTLEQIRSSVGDGGRAVFNYPKSPRFWVDSATGLKVDPDVVADEIQAVFGAKPERVGGTKQTPVWEVKPAGPPESLPIVTKAGTKIRRHKGNVGKAIGGKVFVHKDYASDVIPAQVLSKAEAALGESDYTAVRYDPKTKEVRFDFSSNFDTAREPTVDRSITVSADGTVGSERTSPLIWHHKWMWVKDDYSGFNVQESRNWSRRWAAALDGPAKGNAAGFEAQLREAGVPDGQADLTLLSAVSDRLSAEADGRDPVEAAAREIVAQRPEISIEQAREMVSAPLRSVAGGTQGRSRAVSDADRFRSAAFRKAAEAVRSVGDDIYDMSESQVRELTGISGKKSKIVAQIMDMIAEGRDQQANGNAREMAAKRQASNVAGPSAPKKAGKAEKTVAEIAAERSVLVQQTRQERDVRISDIDRQVSDLEERAEGLKVASLKKMARDFGVDDTGTKAEIKARLSEARRSELQSEVQVLERRLAKMSQPRAPGEGPLPAAPPVFEITGRGYDYGTAIGKGLSADADGKWPDVAEDGRVLKGSTHPNFWKVWAQERANGNIIVRRKNKMFSVDPERAKEGDEVVPKPKNSPKLPPVFDPSEEFTAKKGVEFLFKRDAKRGDDKATLSQKSKMATATVTASIDQFGKPQNMGEFVEQLEFGERPPTDRPREAAIAAGPPPLPPDPTATRALTRYDGFLRQQRQKMQGQHFKAGPLRSIYPNWFEVMGWVEKTMGEPGVWRQADELVRARQVQEKANIAFTDSLKELGSGPNDLHNLPAEFNDVAIKYFEGGRQERADSPLPDHWKNVADAIIKYEREVVRPMAKRNRVYRFVEENHTEGFTDTQKAVLAPIRQSYREMVAGRISPQEYEARVQEFLLSDASNELVVENYFPHRMKMPGGADDATFMKELSILKSNEGDKTPPKRSQRSAHSRQDNSRPDPTVNPYVQMYRHIRRQTSIYYLQKPINDSWAKMVTGRYPDGRKANLRGDNLLDETTTKQFKNTFGQLVGLRGAQPRWEQVIRRIRGNHYKTVAGTLSIQSKQPFQRFLGGANSLRDFRAYELAPWLVRSRFQSELSGLYGEELGESFWERTENEVLLGKQMLREFYGEGNQRTDIDFSDAWGVEKFFLQPIWKLTDNRLIDLQNRTPLIGGDLWADVNRMFDEQNRLTNMAEWMRRSHRLMVEENLPWEEARGKLAMNRLLPWEEAEITRLVAEGNREEAAFEIAKAQTRVGQYVYDSKLRSLVEASPVPRAIAQYATWWRGYSMRVYRDYRTATSEDWFSEDPIRQRLNAVRSLSALALLSGMGGTIQSYVVGDDEPGQNTADAFVRTLIKNATPDPTSPAGIGGASTLATPINLITRLFEERQAPSQATDFMFETVLAEYNAVSDASKIMGNLTMAQLSGDQRNITAAENAANVAIREAATWGDRYLTAYYVTWVRATRTADVAAGYRNANWIRVAFDKALGAERREKLLGWYDPYQPEEEARTTRRIWHDVLQPTGSSVSVGSASPNRARLRLALPSMSHFFPDQFADVEDRPRAVPLVEPLFDPLFGEAPE